MATITVDYDDQDFLLRSGRLVVKMATPHTLQTSRLDHTTALVVPGRQRSVDFPAKQKIGAVRTFNFYDDVWKGRTHLLTGNKIVGWSQKSTFALGNVLTVGTRSFLFYNAREYASDVITALVQSNLSGIAIDDPTPPDVVSNLQSKTYTLTIAPIGPPVINGYYTFTIGGVAYLVYLTGTRTLVFPYEPQRPAVERWEWLTGVTMAMQGTERRQSMRDLPRQTWNYRFRHKDAIQARIEHQIWPEWDQAFAVPVWRDATTLSAAITAGVNTFTVADATNRDFRQGGDEDFVLLWTSNTTFEALQVLTIVGNVFTLSSLTLNAWPAGTVVMPLNRSNVLGDSLAFAPFVTGARDVELSFAPIGNKEVASQAGFTVYKSLPVYEDPLYQTGLQFARTFSRFMERFDGDVGRISADSFALGPQMVSGFVAHPRSRAEYWKLRGFIMSLRGQQKPFWLSSGTVDFRIAIDAGAPSASIVVANVGYSVAVFPQATLAGKRLDIEIVYTNGAKDYRTITNAGELSSTTESLTLSSATSQNADAAKIARISFLNKVRLATDTVEFTHNGVTYVEVPLSVTDVSA